MARGKVLWMNEWMNVKRARFEHLLHGNHTKLQITRDYEKAINFNDSIADSLASCEHLIEWSKLRNNHLELMKAIRHKSISGKSEKNFFSVVCENCVHFSSSTWISCTAQHSSSCFCAIDWNVNVEKKSQK